MSMTYCFICGDIYDTDFQMELDSDGNMICNNCWEKEEAKAENLMLDKAEEERHENYPR